MIKKSITWEDAIQVRHEVLWPNKAAEFCKLPYDEQAKHFGVFVENKFVSVASIYINANSARLRKFGTLKSYQGNGIGTKLLMHILEEIKQLKINNFWCDARITAVNFYKKFGMKTEGNNFLKSGIPYYKMTLNL